MARRALTVSAAALALAVSTGAAAAPAWTGDFETNNLNQWTTTLNGSRISVVTTPVLQGSYAGRIQLTNDDRWQNGIKRVELNHKPQAARTAEGADTYFAWSFYLPEALAADPPTQIGYWESEGSYMQMMSFEVVGQNITFATRQPTNKVHWEARGAVTPGEWHRIALHITWSKDENRGAVDVWFDGQQVVTGAKAKTLAGDTPHFTQIGLLRNPSEFTDSPVLFLDDAVEGDSLDDVRPAPPSGEGGAGGAGGDDGAGGGQNTGGSAGETGGGGSGGGGAGGATASSSAASGGASSAASGGASSAASGGTTSAASGGAASAASGGETDGDDGGDEGGCSVRKAGSPAAPVSVALAGLLAALAFARRRRTRR